MGIKIIVAATTIAAAGLFAGTQAQQSSAAPKTDSAVVKVEKQTLPKRSAATQVPKPATNWSKIKDLFL